MSLEKNPRRPLRGGLLYGIRVLWVVIAVLTLLVFAISVRLYFVQQNYMITLAERLALREIGLSIKFSIVYTIVPHVITMLVFSAAAVELFWLRSDDWIVILVSTALLTFGAATSPTLSALQARPESLWHPNPVLYTLVLVVQGLGIGSTLLVFYLFPNGRFVPRWTGWLALIWGALLLALASSPTVDPYHLSFPLRFLLSLVTSDPRVISQAHDYLRTLGLAAVLLGWFGSGVLAQIYRYTHVSAPVQRQQTRWVVFGLTAAAIGAFAFYIPPMIVPALRDAGLARSLYYLIGYPIYMTLLLLVPVSIRVSILRYRLWRIDPIIQRALVYGTLTGALAVLYVGSVLLFQQVFRRITGYQSTLAVAVSTLMIAALVTPLRRRLQDLIDRRFYRERVDFRRAFTNFSNEVRTIIELPELLQVLVNRTTNLLHITHGAVFLRKPDGTFQQAETHITSVSQREQPAPPTHEGEDVSPSQDEPAIVLPAQLSLERLALDRLRDGIVISRPKDAVLPLLVPLIAPRTEGSEFVGVLALGHRLSGQDYSREDRNLLKGLADQAGTAIYVARLIDEKQEEARLRERAERRLEEYRNSPVGRAEAFAQTLLAGPETALVEVHALAQRAWQDADTASLLDNLPRVLNRLGITPLARLAEGFNHLVASQHEPELLPVGLRTIIAQLEETQDWQCAADALSVYRLCQTALNAGSIAQITQLLSTLQARCADQGGKGAPPCGDLINTLAELHTVAEALYAYERVDTARDKLAYLASGVERLRHVDHLARTELSGVDRSIARRVVEGWMAVVTGAMSELQTRAQIVCRLLTRRTWQGDVISLALSLYNEGRGAALNITVALAPSPEYTTLDEVARIERLAPGEEARVELRVRPHLAQGVDHFRARFVILYTDPRGPDQIEHFADVVHLLTAEREFQFIPNPYVVGAPLDTGSPLFFGREDVVAFVQENLAALHRNDLVLIGQRRTGKTSLLKQLPMRLGDNYIAVYLDGQALGLDPGLPNFFLNLALEIAFALEDRGIGIEPPELADFADSPAVSFERGFLARVRQAIGERHLLIMLDEFEELEAAVQRGNLDASVFGFLRHLIQHVGGLSLIFCGTHRLEELAADYWSVLFNISLYRHIGALEKPEALRLIQEPVTGYGMHYDDLALDKIWQVTSGHPYFLQLLCHSLVNHHNKTKRNYVTVADVNAALEEILASGEAHFVYLWTEATPEERLALAALSRMIPLTGQITPVQITDYLAERGVALERRAIADALHRLALRDVLAARGEADPAAGETYQWRLGLLGLWVEKYQSLGRVIDEVRG